MAEIYLARATGISGFEKYVALKMIHRNYAEDEHFIEMLVEEAKIVVHLTQPNIVQIFDLGRIGDVHYIAMEYVDGADLYQVMRTLTEAGHMLDVDVAAYLAQETCAALDYAHRCRDQTGRSLGIIHRDISPQNILISRAGEVKLADFGIAKATVRARQTAVGVIKGKYYYMSPEQAWGDKVDHRTDIFSTGVVLYETLVGQMLYLDEDIGVLLDKVRKADITPPSRLRPDIPPPLEQIVMKAVARRPDDRYATAHDLQAALQQFLYSYAPNFTVSRVRTVVERALSLAAQKQTFDLGGPGSEVGTAELEEGVLMSVQEYLPLTTHSLLSVEVAVDPGSSAADDDDFGDATMVSDPPDMADYLGGVPPILPISVESLASERGAVPAKGWEEIEDTTAVLRSGSAPGSEPAAMPPLVTPAIPRAATPGTAVPVPPPGSAAAASAGPLSEAMALPPIPASSADSPGPETRAPAAPLPSARDLPAAPGPGLAPAQHPGPGLAPAPMPGPAPVAGFDVPFDTGDAEASAVEEALQRGRRHRLWILGGVVVCLVLLAVALFIISARKATTEPGSVRVETVPPGAQVFYRGKLVGRTPHRLDSLRLDEVHWVRLESDICESKAVRLNVKAGKTQTLKVKLENCESR